ncbi:MAG TPA: hypothetical protein VIH86_10860 [Puia sp.]
MKTVFFGFIAVLFFMMTTGCSKELSVETNEDSVVIIPDTTYQPLETPSFWVYQDSTTSVKDTLTATDSLMTINSKVYTVFHNSSAGQTADEYFNISSHNYYSYGSFGNGLDTIELLYLNDTASPGYNWQAPAGSINGFPAQVQGQIIDTGLTVTIGSNTFTNVIHSEIEIEYNVGSGFQTPYAVYDYYVAKGVGIIKIVSDFPSVPYTATSYLISYKIQ